MPNPVISFLRFFSNALIDFVFPPRCFGCDQEIDQGLVCPKCFTQVTTNALGVCPVCGLPQDDYQECKHLLLVSGVKPHTLFRIRALGKYLPPYKGLVRNFKYRSKTKIGKTLGLGLANVINSDPILSRARYLVPIPLHPARLRERGYNQSLLLAQETAFNSGITLFDCLKRVKYTKSQTKLEYVARLKNIRGAYQIKPDMDKPLRDTRIILIDDVITTGATLSEAAKVLKDNGAREIYAAVVITAQV